MMTMDGSTLVLTTHRRAVTIQNVTTCDRYLALVGCGVRESIAMAIVAKLIVCKVRI